MTIRVPTAVCRNISVYLDLNTGTTTITASDINGGSSDNCGIASMTIDIDHFDCTNIGPNNVTLTVTDNSGNTARCTAVVTVNYAANPIVSPLTDVICNGGVTGITLTSDIPSTTWTWSAAASTEISGAGNDNSGLLASIIQTLNNSDKSTHNVIYTIVPRVYGQCNLPSITSEVWVNPTPEIQVSPAEQAICYGETASVNVGNPNISVRGQWLYDLIVTPDPEISGNSAGGTFTSPVNLNETLINTGTEKRTVVYRFIPRISPDDGGPDCIGKEQIIRIVVHPRCTIYY